MPKGKSIQIIFANVKIKSISGQSIFDTKHLVTSDDVELYYGDKKLFGPAIQILQSLGFKVLYVHPLLINISGSKDLFEKVFNKRIILKKYTPDINRRVVNYWDVEKSQIRGLIPSSETPLEEYSEGISICQPVEYFQTPTPSPDPPTLNYYHLEVPSDISRLLNADITHSRGVTGSGVRVVIVDSGWYRHPYFDARDYQIPSVFLGPGAADISTDDIGHGTGIASNLFAIAPDATVDVVKSDLSKANMAAAFLMACDQYPDVISCSWGWSIKDRIDGNRDEDFSSDAVIIGVAVSIAVMLGICVVFAAGNGQYGWPAQHPDVIAVGGVYVDQNGGKQASAYSSGFVSELFDNRIVPDVCGLVGNDVDSVSTLMGMGPPAGGMYIAMPTQPLSDFEVLFHNGGLTHPLNPNNPPQQSDHGDETAQNDGWLVASGTSSAAPQVAGVCALIRQVKPSAGPFTIRDLLMETARDITDGQSRNGSNARNGIDAATGAGLVNCEWAVARAEGRQPQVGARAVDLREHDLRFEELYIQKFASSFSKPPRNPWANNPVGFPSLRAIVNRLTVESSSKDVKKIPKK